MASLLFHIKLGLNKRIGLKLAFFDKNNLVCYVEREEEEMRVKLSAVLLVLSAIGFWLKPKLWFAPWIGIIMAIWVFGASVYKARKPKRYQPHSRRCPWVEPFE